MRSAANRRAEGEETAESSRLMIFDFVENGFGGDVLL